MCCFTTDKGLLKLIGRYLRAGVPHRGETPSDTGGGPARWSLGTIAANLLLEDLDKRLEAQHLRFARYADDFTICVKSSSAGYRIMAWVSRFLNTTLKLVVNEER